MSRTENRGTLAGRNISPIGIPAALVLAMILFVFSGRPAQDGGALTPAPAPRPVRGFGQGGFGNAGPRSRPGPSAELDAPRDAEMRPARFQATVYEVQAGADQARALDAKSLAGQASTSETLLTALGQVGKSRILYRLDQLVNLFSDVISIGSQEPVIVGTQMTDTGQAINSISYRGIGLNCRLSVLQPPNGSEAKRPDVNVAFQLSSLAPGETESVPGLKSSGIRVATLEQSEALAFDQPRVMVATGSSPPQAKAAPAVFVVRYQFSRALAEGRTAEPTMPATNSADAAAGIAASPASVATNDSAKTLPARFQATFYEVTPAGDQLGALDADSLVHRASSAETLLEALASAGRSRVLYRIDQPVNVLADQITVSTNVPIVTGTRQGVTGNAINSITYQSSGVVILLSARTPAKAAPGEATHVAMSINLSVLAPSDVEIGLSQMATATHSLSLIHSEALAFGKPRVMVSVCPSPSSTGDRATPIAYVVRYSFSPPNTR